MTPFLHNPYLIHHRHTLTMFPRESLDFPEYWNLIGDIRRKFTDNVNATCMKIAGGGGYLFDIPPTEPDGWTDRVFLFLPPYDSPSRPLRASPAKGYQIEIAVVSYRVGLWNGFTVAEERYKQDLPLEFFIKIADAMDKYKIELDTSLAEVENSAF